MKDNIQIMSEELFEIAELDEEMKFIVSKKELYKFSHAFAMLCHDMFFQEALSKEKKQIPAVEFVDNFIERLQIYKEKEK